MYETIVKIHKYIYIRYCVSICQKKVGDGCFYRRKKMHLDVLLVAR